MTDNLLAEIAGDSVDQSELEQLLLAHFGGSTGISQDEIHYIHTGTIDPALIVKYKKDGDISAILAGQGLRTTDIEHLRTKITQQLIEPRGCEIGQLVLFAHTPLVGGFRYRDSFEILPKPDDAPRPTFMMGDHPLLLQFQYAGSADIQIGMLRRTRIGRELELLLVALVSGIKGSISPVVRHHWSIVTGDDNPANWKSAYCQEGYIWPNANGVGAGYIALENYGPIARTVAAEHYTRLGISVGQTLDLPDVLEQLLDIYFSMDRDNRDRFIRASFWFQYSQRASQISHSGAFTALVSSVEALMPETKPDSHCPKCDRPIGIGPTKKFAEFVERYAGKGLTNGQRRELYSLRSALSHGGSLLHSDRFGWGGGMTSTSLSQWTNQHTMWQIVRLVLVNWLFARQQP